MPDAAASSSAVPDATAADARASAFVTRWRDSAAAERANYQLFLSELCDVLGVGRPDPARPDDRDNAYVFERRVTFDHADGTHSAGRIDLYKRGCFVLEAKQGSGGSDDAATLFADPDPKAAGKAKRGTAVRGTAGWDAAMEKARGQAERYVRALPPGEGNPPFVLVVDVGHTIEVFAEFTRLGKNYTPFPDPRTHRIALADLARPEVRDRLARVWTDPLGLDPARHSAKVTRQIADRLAALARSLEKGTPAQPGHPPETVALFLMRCLFTFFAEDVGLLPKAAFTDLLKSLRGHPDQFVPMVQAVWRDMNAGGFNVALRQTVKRFNGGLFEQTDALPVDAVQLELLIQAGEADWADVEPAIFGTLLERALDDRERHKLGAHYTPRAYVERLVLPTVIEPLREQFDAAKAAAFKLSFDARPDDARQALRDFLSELCRTTVLDPACGTGNFLYVTMEHMKRLEGEVRQLLLDLGDTDVLASAGLTVDPHQFLGLEINPRAKAIAELVLWIGYLKWFLRTTGHAPQEPILRDFKNIRTQDAVLAYDRKELVTDEQGRPVSRWDGRTMKVSPVTGEEIPDESARVPVYRYVNPRKAEWPEADYVVGNPPFIGSKRMRELLDDGYVDAVQAVWPEIPQATDFVLRWWHHASELVRAGDLQAFGLITTNSIGHAYNRRVIEQQLRAASGPLSIVFAIPDHPWVDIADGADVRIAMTVGVRGRAPGVVTRVVEERERRLVDADDLVALMSSATGVVNADLSIGVDLDSATELRANLGLCCVGMKTIGEAFILTSTHARLLGLGEVPGLDRHIRPYVNGRDLAGRPRGVMVIDLYGLTSNDVRDQFPAVYQYLLNHAKPERDQNRNRIFRDAWWIIGHPRRQFRNFTSGLRRYIATIETSKHRFFSFFASDVTPDSTLVTFGLDDAFHLGVLSNHIHVVWALATGGRLGVGNDPRYNKTRCYEPFPFPICTEKQRECIRALGESLDAHRKRQQAAHPGLTITDMYNVLEKLRRGDALSAKDKTIHEQGLVSVLRQIHDDLDAAVADAYGWPAPSAGPAMPDDEILRRLVALNAERADEERRGLVRWLRPAFQNPAGAAAAQQADLGLPAARPAKARPAARPPWPKTLAEQARAVRAALTARGGTPATPAEVARTFAGARADKVGELLAALAGLGQARADDGGRYAA